MTALQVPTPTVLLDQVARRFARQWPLRGVSLRLAKGDGLALLGRNGSGKTTLLRVLATAIRATRGRGQVCGFDLTTEADAVREHVGLLGHATALYPDLTARENLLFAQRMHGGSADPRAAEAALERVGLAYHRNERVRDFSAGMARRVALARLLLRSHELLLLDEPYASFDGEGVDLLNEVLLEARGRGSTVIVATHDPARAAGVLDRTAQLEDGRLIEPVPR